MSDQSLMLWITGGILTVTGLAGTLLPVLPGAPLLFLGLLCAAWAEDFWYRKIYGVLLPILGGDFRYRGGLCRLRPALYPICKVFPDGAVTGVRELEARQAEVRLGRARLSFSFCIDQILTRIHPILSA